MLYLSIADGVGDDAVPLFASADPELIRAVGGIIAQRLGCTAPSPIRALAGAGRDDEARRNGLARRAGGGADDGA